MSGSGPKLRQLSCRPTTTHPDQASGRWISRPTLLIGAMVLGTCIAPALPANPATAAPPQALSSQHGSSRDEGATTIPGQRDRPGQPKSGPQVSDPALPAVTTMTVQPPDEDASIESAPAYAPYTAERLLIGGGGSMSWRAALRFDLSGLPQGAQVTSAYLGLYFDGYCLSAPGTALCGGTSHLLDVHRVSTAWATSTISDNVRYDSAVTGSYLLANGAPQGWMTWPVTPLVRQWLAGTPNYGLIVTRRDEQSSSSGPAPPGRRFTGSAALRPRLVISYTSDAVQLAEPTILHGNGAELSWTRYAGTAPFARYELHRSTDPDFTPGAATRIATITNRNTTTFRDTTAPAGRTVTYRVVVNGTAVSNPQPAALPAPGFIRTTLRLAPATGKMTYLYFSTQVTNCANYGAMPHAWVGSNQDARWRALVAFDVAAIPRNANVTSATLSLWRLFGPTAPVTVDVHQVLTPWTEGTGAAACTGDGATWYDAAAGHPWTSAGADENPAAAAAATVPAGAASGASLFNLTALVRGWVGGAANNGVLLRLANENMLAGNSVVYASDDYSAETTLRPTLTVTYAGN